MSKGNTRWILALLAVVAAGVGLWRISTSTDPSGPNGSETPAVAHSGDTATLTAQPALDASGVDEPSRPESSSVARSDIRTAAPIAKEWPKSAKDEEDARWLASRLYPTDREFKNYYYSGEAVLPADLDPDNVAEILSAERLVTGRHLSEEVRRDARIALENAATRGATYALVALGLAFENGTDLRTYIESQAYFRAAIMLGDWSVSLRPKRQLLTAADAFASMRALALLVRMDQARAQRGLPPLRRDVRPGLEYFMAGIEADALMQQPPQDPSP